MKILLLSLALLTSSPSFTIDPTYVQEPATIKFLVTGIPAGSQTACFVLDGDNYYYGCKDVRARRSYQVEYKNVYAGRYTAEVRIDNNLLPVREIVVTKVGPE